ncbi:MAG TPA: hypothetical protein VG964_03035 [Candidatus Saccharimonadales bacterium]|nr:hypothetical protein [Candidatus Saccharimonadales bacterium]
MPKSKSVEESNPILRFFGSSLFIKITYGWFFVQAFYMSVSTVLGVSPDEKYHLQLIRLFTHNGWLPFIHDQTGNYSLGEVVHTPFFIYQYFLSLPNHFFGTGSLSLYLLRFINILLGLGSLWLTYRLAEKLKLAPAARNIAVFLLANTLMFVFLFSAISYDNLLVPASLASFLLVLSLRDRLTLPKLALLLICLLVGSMTAINYLPVGFVCGILALFIVLKNPKQFIPTMRASFNKSRRLSLGLLVVVALLAALFGQRYALNLVRYHTYQPACTTSLTLSECMQDGIYARSVRLDARPKKPITLSGVGYLKEWVKLMDHRVYGIFGHKSIDPSRIIMTGSFVLFAAGIIAALVGYRPRDVVISWTLAMIVFYVVVLLYDNHKTYLRYGSVSFAVQGRYIFPVLPLIYLVVSKYIWQTLKPTWAKIVYGIVFCMLFLGFCLPAYLYKSTPAWHTVRTAALNSHLRNLIDDLKP